MPKRISVADATPLRTVIVTMDGHMAGAAERARETLRPDLPGLDLASHAADGWGSNPATLENCLDAVAGGDIIIAPMLFLEDPIRAVQPALAETYELDPELRDRLAASNATTSAKLANRLIEAHERHFWFPDPATLDALRRAGEEFEDRLEGIVSEKVAA